MGSRTLESDGAEIFTLPVEARCGSNVCRHGRKGYALSWTADDLLVQGTIAWYTFAGSAQGAACIYEADGIAATFAHRDGFIRTFCPVVTPKPNPLCVAAAWVPTSGGNSNDAPPSANPVYPPEECGQ